MRVLPIQSAEDIPMQYTVITCGISGGTYEEYLASMREKYGKNLCLWLSPIYRKFFLPDYTGQGVMLSPEELENIKKSHRSFFSSALCTNYIFLPEPPTVILFDDEASLKKKAELAQKFDILLAAENTLIQKIKAP